MNAATQAAERFSAALDSITTLSPADRLVLKFAAQEYAAALVQECARPAQWGSRPTAKDGAA